MHHRSQEREIWASQAVRTEIPLGDLNISTKNLYPFNKETLVAKNLASIWQEKCICTARKSAFDLSTPRTLFNPWFSSYLLSAMKNVEFNKSRVAHIVYVIDPSYTPNQEPVVGRSALMQTTRHNGSHMKCKGNNTTLAELRWKEEVVVNIAPLLAILQASGNIDSVY